MSKRNKWPRPTPSQPLAPTILEPRVEVQAVPPLSERDGPLRFWPLDVALPAGYVKSHRRRVPCRGCRRLFMDDGGQAVVCTHSRDEIAYFRCKECGHRFSMPVVEE